MTKSEGFGARGRFDDASRRHKPVIPKYGDIELKAMAATIALAMTSDSPGDAWRLVKLLGSRMGLGADQVCLRIYRMAQGVDYYR